MNKDNETVRQNNESNQTNPAGAAESAATEFQIPKKQKKKSAEAVEAKLQAEIAEITERLMRTTAEYDNYRKRTDREKASAAANGVAFAIEKLLPVLDTLEIAAVAHSTDAEYKKGVELTLGLFLKAIDSLGVKPIEAVGEPFDPQLHNAVANEESDQYESGTVCGELQKGYVMGDRVLRHSMVMVVS